MSSAAAHLPPIDVEALGARLPLAGSRVTAERCGWQPRDLEIMPEWLGRPLEREPCRGANRGPAAAMLDREVGPVAMLEARCREIQATIAAEFLRRQLWKPLGFVRVGDYTAERLGMQARTLQEDARVITALAGLPNTRSAFEIGAIWWTHARLITTVAAMQTEGEWLAAALANTTRTLARLVKMAGKDGRVPKVEEVVSSDRSSTGATTTVAGDAIDANRGEVTDATAAWPGAAAVDEAPVWSRSVELAYWSDSEAVIVETPDACAFHCGVPPVEPGGQPTPNACAAWTAPAPTPNACAPSAASAPTPDACAADSYDIFTSSADFDADIEPDPRPEPPTDATTADLRDGDPVLRWSIDCTYECRRLWRVLLDLASRMHGTDVGAAAAIETIAAEAMSGPAGDPSTCRDRLREPGPSSRDRSERFIRAFESEHGVSEGFRSIPPRAPKVRLVPELERLLVGLADADAFELDARLRTIRTAMQRLDWQLGALLRTIVDRKLHRELGFATLALYAEARLGISASKAWALIDLHRRCIHRAKAVREAYRDGRLSYLAARQLVEIVNDRNEEEWIARAQEVTLRRLTAEVSWALDRRDEPGQLQWPSPPPHDLDVTADALARIDEKRLQMRALPEADPHSMLRRAPARIVICAPRSILEVVEDAIAGCRQPGEPKWRGFERMLSHAYLTWMAQPRHRNRLYARDNHRCQVPGCTRRATLELHHLWFRSQLGPDWPWNLTAVCAEHHRYAIHHGYIRAHGRAPGSITWEMGCRPGFEPLMVLMGDRYVRR